MKPEQLIELYKFITIVFGTITGITTVVWKYLADRVKSRERIEIEKIKNGSFGEDQVRKLTKELSRLNEDFIRAERKISEIERQWVEFRDESRRTNKELRETAEQWTVIFKDWAKSIQETRDYINEHKT